MIAAQDFVSAAAKRGFSFYAGVPCSYLTTLIHCVLGSPGATYIASANEGDALATAAGAALGGQPAIAFMQNSGLGNAVNPLASLTAIFRIPVLLIVSLRGDPRHADEPQHRLMGQITGGMLDLLEIPWQYIPEDPQRLDAALEDACTFMKRESLPYAFVARRDSFADARAATAPPPAARAEREPRALPPALGASKAARPSRQDALQRLIEATPEREAALIATTGYTGRELWALADRPNQFYMVGSMGCAAPFGLGLSLVRPDLRVVVADGDGAALMRLGSLATLGAYGSANLIHVVLDNESHESTGGQHTVSSGVSFAGVAQACGYGPVFAGATLDALDAVFGAGAADSRAGPRLAHLKIRPGTPQGLPRPDVPPEQVRRRFAAHLGAMGERGDARGT